ncbi:MAG: HD domain-containing phosphohydrolase [Planctomycetota bacterium]
MSRQSNADDSVHITVDELKVGVVCSTDLLDEEGKLLLGTGTRITAELIQGLHDRGIQEIEISAADASKMRGGGAGGEGKRRTPRRRTIATPRGSSDGTSWPKGTPLKPSMVDRHEESLSPERTKQLRQNLQVAREEFETLRMTVMEEKLKTISAMKDLSNAFAMALVDDHDHAVGEIVRPTSETSITDRSVRLAVLGMAVATEMDLDGPSVLEVGSAGLLHDIGLVKMDPEFSKPNRDTLSDEQMWQFRKHPLVSSSSLKEISDVPNGVLLSIEQVHEQYNGSGFPFGLEGNRTHQYARILNVCDTYLQLTMGASFRKPLVPHDAMGLILHQARHGLFDPKVIHAFLRTESLFPLGSRVELSDGTVADVIRRPTDGYSTPVLEDVEGGNRIELEKGELQIVRPVIDESCNQMRLSVGEMQSLYWNPADELLINSGESPASNS